MQTNVQLGNEPPYSERVPALPSPGSAEFPAGIPNAEPKEENQLPIFEVTKVDIQFGVGADFAAAQVANNVLVLGLHSGKIMRIDLDVANEVDDIDLPKKVSEVGVIKRIFLDPTASHLIVCTTLGENFYLHTQSRQPKLLSKLKGISIESISWNPSQPTASTREILIGAVDGSIYETYIESTTDFLQRQEKYTKYVKFVFRVEGPASSIWTDSIPGRSDLRRILIATPKRLIQFVGRLGRHGHEGSGSVFARLFESETPTSRQVEASATATAFTVTPEPPNMPLADTTTPERIFAWLSADGILYGRLLTTPIGSDLAERLWQEARMLHVADLETKNSKYPHSHQSAFVALTQWHVLQLIGNRMLAINRLDGSIVFDQTVLDADQRALGLAADMKKNTFWLFTSTDIFEIEVRDEDRNVWKVMLKSQNFEAALQYANSPAQRDAVATASGDYLFGQGKFSEAASVYGNSSKSFEQIALSFIDKGEKDALRKYLLAKLSMFRSASTMQRIMLTSWLTELFMSKLNSLDDMVNTKAELAEKGDQDDMREQRRLVRKSFEEFVRKYQSDLDQGTIYDIISSHGRESELLYYSTAIGDNNFVLSYWVQRENWPEALTALNRQTDPDTTYKYSSVLMAHAAVRFIDIVMRQPSLEPRKLIPALLNYNKVVQPSLKENQAIRYLKYEINDRESRDAAIHNTLISIYASAATKDEAGLMSYLESQTPTTALISTSQMMTTSQLPYDADFALRLCVTHSRIRSCCLIYTIMGQYVSAVELALAHKQTDLAISIADRPEVKPDKILSKKIWLSIARTVIDDPSSTLILNGSISPLKSPTTGLRGLASKPAQADSKSTSIKTALTLLHHCPPDTLRIEDLLPLLPDFLLIDAFKSEICSALASYSADIDSLKGEMDASAGSSKRLQREIESLDERFVIVRPGESCAICGEVLVERRFWVWGCGHGVHGDCAVESVETHGTRSVQRRVKELRLAVKDEKRRRESVKELDDIVGKECLMCGEIAVGMVDTPFDESEDWSL